MIAQDLASWGLDRRASGEALDVLDERQPGVQPLVSLVGQAAQAIERVRLLYLYPSGLTEGLIEAILATGVPYFDLSLQHASASHLRRMRRWGGGERFLERIAAIRAAEPISSFRSSFIVGYPGETEADHDELLEFLDEAQLDWAGFFAFSPEEGTYAAGLDGQVPASLVAERLAEVTERQDQITAIKRDEKVGEVLTVLVDEPGIARSTAEAPEIDGVIVVPDSLEAGTMVDVEIVASLGTDLEAVVRSRP